MVIIPRGPRGQIVMTILLQAEHGHARELSTEESAMANLKKTGSVVRYIYMALVTTIHVD